MNPLLEMSLRTQMLEFPQPEVSINVHGKRKSIEISQDSQEVTQLTEVASSESVSTAFEQLAQKEPSRPKRRKVSKRTDSSSVSSEHTSERTTRKTKKMSKKIRKNPKDSVSSDDQECVATILALSTIPSPQSTSSSSSLHQSSQLQQSSLPFQPLPSRQEDFMSIALQAETLRRKEKFTEALGEFNRAMTKGGNIDLFAATGRAFTFLQLDYYEEAHEAFHEVLSLLGGDQYPLAVAGHARTLLELEKYPDAYREFVNALSLPGGQNFPESISGYAVVLNRIGKFNEAEKEFNRALALKLLRKDRYLFLYTIVHYGLNLLNLKKFKEAEKEFAFALNALNPKDGQTYFLAVTGYALTFFHLRNYKKAKPLFEMALPLCRKDTERSKILNIYLSTLLNLGQITKADFLYAHKLSKGSHELRIEEYTKIFSKLRQARRKKTVFKNLSLRLKKIKEVLKTDVFSQPIGNSHYITEIFSILNKIRKEKIVFKELSLQLKEMKEAFETYVFSHPIGRTHCIAVACYAEILFHLGEYRLALKDFKRCQFIIKYCSEKMKKTQSLINLHLESHRSLLKELNIDQAILKNLYPKVIQGKDKCIRMLIKS